MADWIFEFVTIGLVIAFWAVATKPYVFPGHDSHTSGGEAGDRETVLDLFLANGGKMTARHVKTEVGLIAWKRAERADGTALWLKRGGGRGKYQQQLDFCFPTMVPGQRIDLDISKLKEIIDLDDHGLDDILKIEVTVTYRWILLGKCWRFREEFTYDLLAYGSTNSSGVPGLSLAPKAQPTH